MIPKARIKIEPLPYYFDSYYIDDAELLNLLELEESGKEQETLDNFMANYINLPATKYQELMSTYLGYADNGPLDKDDEHKLLRNIALLSTGLSALLIWNFSQYLKNVEAKIIFSREKLTNVSVKNAILQEVISNYEQLVSGTMAQTQSFVLNGIRTLQREMITENVLLKNLEITGSALDAAVARFKDSLRAKYSDIYKAMENGNVLVSRKFQGDTESVRHYKHDYYADMSTRSALLNIDRTSVTVMAMANEERVVGFYMADPREVKKDREICKEILRTKVLGKSILALDHETGVTLGIMTVDEAMSTPDYSFGPFCRHGLRRLGKDYLKQIDEMLVKAA